MYNEQLLSKQGPLAHVWLAANYDRKLTRQQLLGTDIVQSSELISQERSSYDRQNSSSQTSGAITLRLSGQLLLGIVKIYSRKTKYLLDDVNDILHKLKASFRYVIGSGTSGIESGYSNVNGTVQSTTVSNVASITLADQVTEYDLLYQEDLSFNDVPKDRSGGIFNLHNSGNIDEEFTFDRSIEIPRYNEHYTTEKDDDFELDFDLGMDKDVDRSIEVGRDVAVSPNYDISVLSALDKDNNELEFDIGIDQPLDTIETLEEQEQRDTNILHEANEGTLISQRHNKGKLVGIGEDGTLRTMKRKLQIDTPEELESGLTIQELKQNQKRQLTKQGYITIDLTESQKLDLIFTLSETTSPSTKRRKTWGVNDELQDMCNELAQEEENNEERSFTENTFDALDFDISLQGLDLEEDSAPKESDGMLIHETDGINSQEDANRAFSIQMSNMLKDAFTEAGTASVTFESLLAKDLLLGSESEERVPLGIVQLANERGKKRQEATKSFFEILVLATDDCIALKQEETLNYFGGQIHINAKDKLYSRFL